MTSIEARPTLDSTLFIHNLAEVSIMTPAPSTLHPLRAETIGDELAFIWSDGQESFIPLEKLRRACPCAACGGEPDVMGNVERPHVSYGPHSFELRNFRFVGGYAFQPTWNDGHDSGLYTFRQLRSLNENASA